LRLYEAALLLHSYGVRPTDIAQTLYDIHPKEWSRLPRNLRDSLLRRVFALIHYGKKRSRNVYSVVGNTSIVTKPYSDPPNDPQIDYSGGVREDRQHSPTEDGTLNVRMRKLLATSDLERWGIEYEQLLYFIYRKVAARYDDSAMTLWTSIKLVHKAIFERFFERYGRVRGSRASGKRSRLAEQVAAYTYLVFFAGLHRFPSFNAIREELVKTMNQMVRDIEKFRQYVQEMLPLFVKFIL